MTISPLLAQAYTFVLIFTLEFSCIENLKLITVSVAAYLPPRASARTRRTRLYTGLNLPSLCHRLVVLKWTITRFDVGLYLQPLCHCLVVVQTTNSRRTIAIHTSFHIRFDFHRCFSFPYFTVEPMKISPLLPTPALTLVLTFIDAFPFFEIDCSNGCRLPIQAKKECKIAGRGSVFSRT